MIRADIYGDYTSETLLGEAFALAPHLRSRFEVVTKCGIQFPSAQRPDANFAYLRNERKFILFNQQKILCVTWVWIILDLLLIHRPDLLMQADEVAEAFHTLRNSGKVKHFGVSNFSNSQFQLLNSRIPLVTNQVECSLLHMNPLEDGLFRSVSTSTYFSNDLVGLSRWQPVSGVR